MKAIQLTVDAPLPVLQNAISRLLPFVSIAHEGGRVSHSYDRMLYTFIIDGPEGEVTIRLVSASGKRKTLAVVTAANDSTIQWAHQGLLEPAIDSIVTGVE